MGRFVYSTEQVLPICLSVNYLEPTAINSLLKEANFDTESKPQGNLSAEMSKQASSYSILQEYKLVLA